MNHTNITDLSNRYRENKTIEECKEICESDSECVSFEYCFYWCDGLEGLMNDAAVNACIINHKNFPQVERLENFITCSNGKLLFAKKGEIQIKASIP